MTPTNTGPHFPSLGRPNHNSTLETTTPNIFCLPTSLFLWTARHPASDFPCLSVGKSIENRGLQGRIGTAKVQGQICDTLERRKERKGMGRSFPAVPSSAIGHVRLAESLVNKVLKVRVQAAVKPLFSYMTLKYFI